MRTIDDAIDVQSFRFKLKSSDATKGEFTGYAAVYGNEDRNGEVIDQGAMKRSINSSDGEFPLLWQHKNDVPIGVVRLKDDNYGAEAFGKVNLDSPMGQQAFNLMVPPTGFKSAALRSMSIGYIVRKEDLQDGVRHLKEIQILEVSLVTVAANPKSNITSVKELRDIHEVRDMIVALQASGEERFSRIESALKAIGATLTSRDLPDDPETLHSLLKMLDGGPGDDSCDSDAVHSLEDVHMDQALSNELWRQRHGEHRGAGGGT